MKIKIDFIGGIKDIIRDSPTELEVSDSNITVQKLFDDLDSRYSGFKDRLLKSDGNFQPNVHVYLFDEKIEEITVRLGDYKRQNNQLEMTVYVLQAYSGGA